MKNLSLAKSYLDKARKRLKTLSLLLEEDDYSDVVRDELSFYGDIDFIPSEQYSKDDAQRAIDDAVFAVQMADLTIQ